MKKIWIGLLLCMAVSAGLHAQKVVARLDLTRRDPKPEFYEHSPVDNGLITLGPASLVSSRFTQLTKYNESLKEEWSVQVFEQNGRKTVDLVSVVGPNILVFVSELFPKENVIKTYYYSYDLKGNMQAGEEVLSVYPNEKEQKVPLQYVLSPNKRKLLCYKNLENRRESEMLFYYLFDESGAYVQSGEIEMKYPDNRFRIRSLRVSNQGNVFVLGKYYKVPIIRESDDFQYIIYRHDLASGQGNELRIELGDRFISDLAFRLDKDEHMYVAGFYSNRGTDQIGGILLQKIAVGGDLLQQSAEPFSAEFLSYYLSRTQIDRGRELRNFYLDPQDGIVLRSDGGLLLIAEKFYLTYQSYRDMYGYLVERPIYHYDDIILTSVSASGEIEWHAIVEKMQQSDISANLSYFSAVGSGGTYLFYEYKPRHLGFNIYYNVVGMDGSVTELSPLIRDYRYGNEFYPRYCTQISNKEALMVYMQNRGKVFSVVKISL